MKTMKTRSWTAPTMYVVKAQDAKANQTGQPYDSSYGYTNNGVLIQLLHS